MYYATMIKIILFHILFFISINSVFCQSPGGVSAGLTVWLKANYGTTVAGVNLTGWSDQSPLLTPVVVNGSPDLVANGYNFNPYVDFTLSSATGGDFLHIPDINLQSFFWVSKLNDLTRKSTHMGTYDAVTLGQPCGGCALHGGENGGAVAQYMESGYANGTFQSAGVWRKDGDATGISFNTPHSGKFNIVSALGGSAIPTNVFMGGQNDNGGFNGRMRDWLGPVGEIISYSGAISAVQANKIETYLGIKYGITLGGNGSTTLAYTSPTSTIIWNANSGYHYDVAGIGRDFVLEALDQPKSHSINTVPDAVTMANSNFTTPTSMVDGEYLVWGHSNTAMTFMCLNFTHGGPSTVFKEVLTRVWRTQKTANPSGNVIIEIDMALLQGAAGLGSATNSEIRLLLDDNIIFSDGSTGEHTYSPSAGFSATSGKLYFTVPYADIQSGIGYFGLGSISTVPFANANIDISICSGIAGSIGIPNVVGSTFLWNPTTGLSSSTVSNPSVTLTNLTAIPVTSMYYVTETNALGCVSIDSVNVTVSNSEISTFTMTPTCDGGISTITGVTGGTFTMVASGAASINAATGTITGGTSGTTYSVTYTTAGTCSSNTTNTVTTTLTDVSTFTTTPTCTGGTCAITGVTGGTFTMVASGAASINATTGTITGGTSGTTYSITYTTLGLCSSSTVVSLTVSNQDVASFVAIPTSDGCTCTITGTLGGTFTFTNPPSDGAVINESTGTVTNATPGLTYNLTYTTNGTCPDSSTETFVPIQEIMMTLFAPNTFTPDGDLYNQNWRVYSQGYDSTSFEINVFNRWGEKVWETKDLNESWNGEYNSLNVIEGTYTWTIWTKHLITDKKYFFTGHINLIK